MQPWIHLYSHTIRLHVRVLLTLTCMDLPWIHLYTHTTKDLHTPMHWLPDPSIPIPLDSSATTARWLHTLCLHGSPSSPSIPTLQTPCQKDLQTPVQPQGSLTSIYVHMYAPSSPSFTTFTIFIIYTHATRLPYRLHSSLTSIYACNHGTLTHTCSMNSMEVGELWSHRCWFAWSVVTSDAVYACRVSCIQWNLQ